MMIVVDRITDGIAVLEEDGKHFQLPVGQLPEGAREGSVLLRTGSGFAVDRETTELRRKALYERTNRIFRKK